MKNIWILNHYAAPPELGAIIRHYKLAEYLINKGHNVKVFAACTVHNTNDNLINNSSKYLYKEYGIVPFIFVKACNYTGNGKKRIKNMMEYAWRLIFVSKNFDKEKPDVVYASSVHPLTWLAGYKLAKRYNAKFIAETRDLWPESLIAMRKIKNDCLVAKLLYKLEKFIYIKADRLVFTFPGGFDYIKSIDLDTSKVRYINNFIDLEEYSRHKYEHIYKDSDLDQKNIFKILFTGSIGRANAIKRIIDAAEVILNKGIKDIRFYIFGYGPEKEKLEQYVIDNNIDNVIFKGKVEKKYIPSILDKSDLNLLCLDYLPNLFKYGLSPNKLFEYFSSGKPTVSNVECGYDMLEKYNCGITVKGGSAEDLASEILRFYSMPKEEYIVYCKNALEAAKKFDYQLMGKKMEQVILEE